MSKELQHWVSLWANQNDYKISQEQFIQLSNYEKLLTKWNQTINLTALTSSKQIQLYHFVDSLELLLEIKRQEHLLDKNQPISLLDIGSGAGFPGMICAVFEKQWNFTLVERVYKKSAFLQTVKRSLGLDVRILSEDIRKINELHQIVVSRAAFPPNDWLTLASHHVTQGGLIFAMLSEKQTDVIHPTGLSLVSKYTYSIESNKRYILTWQKKAQIN